MLVVGCQRHDKLFMKPLCFSRISTSFETSTGFQNVEGMILPLKEFFGSKSLTYEGCLMKLFEVCEQLMARLNILIVLATFNLCVLSCRTSDPSSWS